MLTKEQFALIAPLLPVKRRKPTYSDKKILDAVLYVMSSGCSWRQLPKEYGNWQTIYVRFKRWAESGVLDRVFEELQKKKVLQLRVMYLDSMSVRAHQAASGAVKKKGLQSLGRSRGGLTTKIHLLAAGAHHGVIFSLSAGNRHDAPEGRKLLAQITLRRRTKIAMDKAYGDKKTRSSITRKGGIPVVPPKSNAKRPWKYDKKTYKKRNEIERLFHHLKNFRRIATRYDKLDIMFRAFVGFGLTMLAIK